jgi:hypothetical protein
MSWWRRPWFETRVLAVWIFLMLEKLSLVRDFDGGAVRRQDSNFALTAAEHLGNNIDLAELVDICLAENDRRLGRYDPRLVRPTFVPRLAQLVRRFFASR